MSFNSLLFFYDFTYFKSGFSVKDYGYGTKKESSNGWEISLHTNNYVDIQEELLALVHF